MIDEPAKPDQFTGLLSTPAPAPKLQRWLAKAKHIKTATVAFAGVGAVLSGLLGWYTLYGAYKLATQSPASGSAANAKDAIDPLSVMVLPFANQTGDASKTYVAEGLTVSIASDIARIRNASVLDPTLATAFKERTLPLQQLGRQAGVRFVLRGTLLSSTDTISVAVQLDDASTGATVWNDTINGDVTDLFALQDKVTQHIRTSMGPALMILAAHPSQTRKGNLRAVEATLHARALTLQPLSLQNVNRMTDWYREALKLEPDSAAAQFGLAGTLFSYASHFSSTLTAQQSSAAMREAQTVANKAMRIDPQNLEGLHLLAKIAVARNECPKSEQLMQSLLIAEPKNVRVLTELGDLWRLEGDPAKAIPMLKRAMELEPKRSDWVAGFLGKAYVALGDADSAIPYLQKGLLAQPSVPDLYAWLALAYQLKGDAEHVKKNRERLRAIAPGFRAHDLDQSFSACSKASAAYWAAHVGDVAAKVGLPP